MQKGSYRCSFLFCLNICVFTKKLIVNNEDDENYLA
jgi:hypothetical protein